MVLVCQTFSWTSGKLHNVSPKQCEISRLLKYIGIHINMHYCMTFHLTNRQLCNLNMCTYPFFCVFVNALPVVTGCDFVNSPVTSKMTAPNTIIMAGFQYSQFDCFVSDNLQGSIEVHSRWISHIVHTLYTIHRHYVTCLSLSCPVFRVSL